MGTNYYLEQQLPCPHCKRPYNRLHIGKFSRGFAFSLHVIPELNINDLKDWKKLWKGKKIFNEYEDKISHKKILDMIIYNQIEGAKHHYVDGYHCIGVKDTYDLIIGDFS